MNKKENVKKLNVNVKNHKEKVLSYKEKEKNVLNAKTSKNSSNGSWKNMIPIKMEKSIMTMK
jgi:hypothetical protein